MCKCFHWHIYLSSLLVQWMHYTNTNAYTNTNTYTYSPFSCLPFYTHKYKHIIHSLGKTDFEGIKHCSKSRQYAFQKPKFDTNIADKIKETGALVRAPQLYASYRIFSFPLWNAPSPPFFINALNRFKHTVQSYS